MKNLPPSKPGVKELFTAGCIALACLSLLSSECVLFGDLDCDCDVDIADIMLVAARWHTAEGDPNYDAAYDLDGNGAIDIVDIMLVAVHWGESCPGAEFVRRKGNKLVVGVDEHEIQLRGVNFNNHHWETDASLIINSDHHSEIDFQRVADMGMNVIRFNLSYVVFEDDDAPYVYKQEGWDWLDQNVNWAKKYGVYLILDMHVPQGGYQGGTDEGFALWDDTENQNRLKALWRAIAERYEDEPTIAAWDLINEPTPSQNQAQWETLAQELIDEIRTVDRNHLIVVEIAYGGDYSLFLVDDENVVYDFHDYCPFEYTHQYSYYIGHADGGSYPDPDVSVLPTEFVFADSIENPRVPTEDSNWAFYEGNLYEVADPRIVSGIPTFACDVNQGTVYFDDFVINEYDEGQSLVRRIMFIDVEDVEEWWLLDSIDPFISLPKWWLSWSDDGGGTSAIAEIGHRGSSSFSITGVTSAYTLGNPNLIFAVKQGYHYQISGWMKGVGVTDGSCGMTIEFGQLPPGEEFEPRDRNYLAADLLYWTGFGSTHNVPMNVGEFGLMKWCFEDNKGGLTWVGDMLEILDQYGASYQFYDYHSGGFGVYLNEDGLPDPASANQELVDLFTEFLGGTG